MKMKRQHINKSIVVPQDPLNEPGVYDQGIQSLNTFFDPASIGVNIDGNHLSSVMINNTKGVKTLISYEYQLEKYEKEDFFLMSQILFMTSSKEV